MSKLRQTLRLPFAWGQDEALAWRRTGALGPRPMAPAVLPLAEREDWQKGFDFQLAFLDELDWS